MEQRITLVDDEPSITDALTYALEKEGFQVTVCHTGQSALTAISEKPPSLIVLDIGLPDGNGFEFFRQFREHCSAPVIFLTARNDEIDRVVGLEMGADDYVSKPFSVRELIARIRVVLRRSTTSSDTSLAPKQIGQFHHHGEQKCIRYFNQALELTAQEYKLLAHLLEHPKHVFSRVQLLDTISDSPEHRLERAIDTHIKTLRTKLRLVNATDDPIKTHRGLGYSLEVTS